MGKKKVLYLFSTFVLGFLLITNVSALNIAQADETVVQEGEYDSLRLVAGNNVTNKANINGLSLIAGNEVKANGSAPYGFIAGNNVTVDEKISNDLFVAGNNVRIGSDAEIKRDAYIAASSLKVSTNIGRDLRVGAASVDISGIEIGGDVYIDAAQIILDENTVIKGKLTYEETAQVTGLEKAKIESIETYKNESIEIEINPTTLIYNFVISAIAAYITMLLILLIIPKTKEKLEKVKLSAGEIVKTTAIGLALLIGVPIVSLIALFTGFLTPVALITIVIYIISIYLSTIVVAYIVGNVINTKLIKNENIYLSLAIGIIVVKLVQLIPSLGGLVTAIALFYGLGLIFKYFTTLKK